MNIKPVSDLRNYNVVLKSCQNGSPVYLTKNGRGKYVIVEADEYNRLLDEIKILNQILDAEKRIENGEEYLDMSELESKLGIKNEKNKN